MTDRVGFGWRNVAALTPAFVIAIFTILIVFGLRAAARETEDAERIHEAIRALDAALVRVQDAETAQRGFVLTGDSLFLTPYFGIDRDIAGYIASARALLGPAGHADRLHEVSELIAQRLDRLERVIVLRVDGSVAAAVAEVQSGEGRLLMEQVRASVREMQAFLQARVQEQRAQRRRYEDYMFAVLFGGSILTILLAFSVNSALVWYARNQRLAADELELKNRDLEDQALELEQQTTELESQAAELEEALETVRENEELFRSLIEHAADMIAVIDRSGRTVFESPSFARTFGRDGTSPEVHDLVADIHPDDRERVLGELQRLRRDPSVVSRFEVRLRDLEGGWRHVSAAARMLPRHSALAGVVVNAQDITEARRLEEQFRHAQRMESVGRLAGGVAHDFSNILGIIKGNVQLLQLDLHRDSPIYSELELVNQAADRAAALVHQLLAFSRKQILQPKLIDLNELVVETEKMLRRVIGSDILLRTALDAELGWVNADPGQIQQVLLNLAVNARDAMPEGGSIVIETRNIQIGEGHQELFPHLARNSPAVLLSVSDTGHGMDVETQKHIFEPFFSTKEQGKGTGLGLSTVYGIVKQSRGYIWVYSEPGEGTTFKIYLPRVSLTAEPPSEKAPPSIPAVGEGRILVVEDDHQLRGVMRKLLERSGYTVLEAVNGVEALRLCGEHGSSLRLLVTDMVMPHMSGTELARRVHATLPDLRVLFVSGYTDDTLIQSGRLPQGASFVQKPFDTDEFLRVVAQLLEAGVA